MPSYRIKPERASGDIPRNTLDLHTVSRYLKGVESLCHEAKLSADPKVVLAALEILARQRVTVQELFEGKV